MAQIRHHPLEHGFTYFKIVCLVLAILFAWGVRTAYVLTPQIRSTADKVVRLNDLQNVDLQGKIGGCIPFGLKGNL